MSWACRTAFGEKSTVQVCGFWRRCALVFSFSARAVVFAPMVCPGLASEHYDLDRMLESHLPQSPEMNIEEAAHFLKVPPALVMREIAERHILCWHVNERPRIRIEDLQRYLAKTTAEAALRARGIT